MPSIGYGRDKTLAKRMAGKKREELRAGITGDTVRAGYDDFVEMVLEKMRRLERAESYIDETARVLDLFKMICKPRNVNAITVNTLDRFDAERAKGCRRCSHRSCRWPNPVGAETCWKCEAKLKTETTPVSVETRRKDMRTLQAALGRAVKAYRLPDNPAKDVELPRADEKLPTVLAPAEAKKLLDVADDQWTAFLYVLATSGPRTGDLLSRNWSDMDLDNGLMTVRDRKTRRERLAPLDDHAVTLLAKLRKDRLIVGSADVPVFVRTDGYTPGARWDQHYINRTWPKLLAKAGVKRCRLHDLRKTCATFLAVAGINQRIARGVTGHKSNAVLEKHYQLVEAAALRDAVNKASAPLRQVLGTGA